jgi:large subunit ribosomal protein L18
MYAGIIMSLTNPRAVARIKRKARIRKKITGTSDQPRMSVFRSARHVYAQIIDDTTGVTLATASSVEKGFKEQDKFEKQKGRGNLCRQIDCRAGIGKGNQKGRVRSQRIPCTMAGLKRFPMAPAKQDLNCSLPY